MISFIIPSRNNLPYLKLAVGSIRQWYPEYEIIVLDDDSSDGTQAWLEELTKNDKNTVMYCHKGRQIGHTVLYDIGVGLARNEIFSIFHADMICGPNYVENLLKHLQPKGVVSATRIEPPLHPAGKEKIVQNFGIYDTDFNHSAFNAFCYTSQQTAENKDRTTKGIFAPWVMYKADFLAIGGHDKFLAPFPYEDSDIFQRFILAGYDIKQSRDAFLYHFTCRGHRWTEQVQKDDLFYKLCCAKNFSHYIRKWGSWIQNDEFCFPVIKNLYDVGFIVKNCNPQLLSVLEPWCVNIYCDADIDTYIKQIQPGTPFDMAKRVRRLSDLPAENFITVTFDGAKFTNDHTPFITNLSEIITDSGELGSMEHDIFRFDIKHLDTFQKALVNTNDTFYSNQFRSLPETDPCCLDELFRVFTNLKKNTK